MKNQPSGPQHGGSTGMVAVWASVALGLLFAGASALAGRGTFEHSVLAGLIVMGGLLLLAGVVLAHCVAGRCRLRLRWVIRIGLFASVICVMQIASFIMGLLIHEHDLMAARLFCEQAVSRLDEVHQLRGRYPDTLEEAFGGSLDQPYLFRRSGEFFSSSDGFVLSFGEADGVIPHISQYSSHRRGWTRF